MFNHWKFKTDSKGNIVFFNPKPVYQHKDLKKQIFNYPEPKT